MIWLLLVSVAVIPLAFRISAAYKARRAARAAFASAEQLSGQVEQVHAARRLAVSQAAPAYTQEIYAGRLLALPVIVFNRVERGCYIRSIGPGESLQVDFSKGFSEPFSTCDNRPMHSLNVV